MTEAEKKLIDIALVLAAGPPSGSNQIAASEWHTDRLKEIEATAAIVRAERAAKVAFKPLYGKNPNMPLAVSVMDIDSVNGRVKFNR